jgi:hypothetical protein
MAAMALLLAFLVMGAQGQCVLTVGGRVYDLSKANGGRYGVSHTHTHTHIRTHTHTHTYLYHHLP